MVVVVVAVAVVVVVPSRILAECMLNRTQKSAQQCPGRLVGHICIHYDRGMCFMAACVAVSVSVSVFVQSR